jgi:hypothetical protein
MGRFFFDLALECWPTGDAESDGAVRGLVTSLMLRGIALGDAPRDENGISGKNKRLPTDRPELV